MREFTSGNPLLGTNVTSITKTDDDSFYLVSTTKGTFTTRYVVNAAGLYADEIAEMVGDRGIHLALRKGTMVIFDKSVLNQLSQRLKISPAQVTKKGEGSHQVAGLTKCNGDPGVRDKC